MSSSISLSGYAFQRVNGKRKAGHYIGDEEEN